MKETLRGRKEKNTERKKNSIFGQMGFFVFAPGNGNQSLSEIERGLLLLLPLLFEVVFKYFDTRFHLCC